MHCLSQRRIKPTAIYIALLIMIAAPRIDNKLGTVPKIRRSRTVANNSFENLKFNPLLLFLLFEWWQHLRTWVYNANVPREAVSLCNPRTNRICETFGNCKTSNLNIIHSKHTCPIKPDIPTDNSMPHQDNFEGMTNLMRNNTMLLHDRFNTPVLKWSFLIRLPYCRHDHRIRRKEWQGMHYMCTFSNCS